MVQASEEDYYTIVNWAAQRELDREPHYRDTFDGVSENLILDGTFSTRVVVCYTDNLWAYEEADEEDPNLESYEPLETIAILALSADLEAATEAIEEGRPWPSGPVTRPRDVEY